MSDDARIPRPALLLGLAGLIPFLWSAATHLSPALSAWAGQVLSPMFLGSYVGLTWGTVILSFMSGIATTAQRAEIYKAERFSDHAPLIIDYEFAVPQNAN